MRSGIPRVSVGLPVYNGENFLGQAIESILGQTFEDFELIISDNASCDGTEAICRTFAERDCRIRYYRNLENMGGTPNFNRLVSLARADYFKWAAHDDLCAPDFLEECVAVLDREPTVVLCYSLGQTIDEHGHVVCQHAPRPRTDSPDPRERFFEIMLSPDGRNYEQFGLIRTETLRNTTLMGVHPGSDLVLLAELALAGRFHQIPRVLFSLRDHPDRYTRSTLSGLVERRLGVESLRRRLAWNNPGAKWTVAFPQWRILAGGVSAVLRSNLSWPHRIDCWIALARGAWWFRSILARDLDIGFRALCQRLTRA